MEFGLPCCFVAFHAFFVGCWSFDDLYGSGVIESRVKRVFALRDIGCCLVMMLSLSSGCGMVVRR